MVVEGIDSVVGVCPGSCKLKTVILLLPLYASGTLVERTGR
jgi:hypothetical protein